MLEMELIELANTGEQCVIHTPFGNAKGIVLEVDSPYFRFEKQNGEKYIMYVEDVSSIEHFR